MTSHFGISTVNDRINSNEQGKDTKKGPLLGLQSILVVTEMAVVESFRDVDVQRLSSFLDIDAPDLQHILESAAEGVVFLLKQVQVKAVDYEEISNAKAVLEINYGIPGH